MLHVGILPSHQRWATFMMRLRYVVVDELHTQRGIFGSHVAHVLRRLRRICEHYGARPHVLLRERDHRQPRRARERAVRPSGRADRRRRVAAVRARCSRAGSDPLLDEHSGARARPTSRPPSCCRASCAPATRRSRSRAVAAARELVAQHARGLLEQVEPGLGARVAAYRAGYLASERRELELDLSSGRLLGVAATNALELGIDVGGLDAVVLNGFPGTLASMWQQAGRAGRTDRRAAAVLVAGDDQLDQWYVAHPHELTGRAPERAVVNPQNPFVLRAQVACAAHELPLSPDDGRWFGDGLDDAVRELVQADLLTPRGGRMYWSGQRSPAAGVGLRSGSSVEYRLVDVEDERTIGTVDEARVFARRASGRGVPPPGPAVPRRAARPA